METLILKGYNMKHLDLVRSIAWSFDRTTSVDWEDLFAEGCLHALLALESFDEAKGIPEHLWVYRVVKTRLVDFMRSEIRNQNPVTNRRPHEEITVEQNHFWWAFVEGLSEEAQAVVHLIMDDPHTFLAEGRKGARGLLAKTLMEDMKWPRKIVFSAIRELKQEFKTQ
jgi:DNA-directed RNA polymerase specialized sigma24 family protein